MNRKLVLALGVAAVVAETALWHGPLGAGEQMAGKIERTARRTIEHYEMPLVTARLERSPLRRTPCFGRPEATATWEALPTTPTTIDRVCATSSPLR